VNGKIKKKQRERQEERGRKIERKKERRDEGKVEQFVKFSAKTGLQGLIFRWSTQVKLSFQLNNYEYKQIHLQLFTATSYLFKLARIQNYNVLNE
jgi:hypothetical protein